MKYLKLIIALALAGFTIFLCFWPMFDEIEWVTRLADPFVRPMLNVIGVFAIIVVVVIVLSQL